ncbi:MAG: DUF1653 domain-containing protein [Candidatus Omnitrophota bacterium]
MDQQYPRLKNGIYQHYKGNKYEVVNLARHSETEEWMVVYKALNKKNSDDHNLWVRPLAMFIESVQVDGKVIPRFRFTGEK